MHKKGLFISEIARITGHDRKTIRKLIKLNGPPKPAKRGRAGKLDPFKDYLKQRLGEGCSKAALLFEEIQAMGFTGRDRIVRKFLKPYRPLIKAKAQLPGNKGR